MKIFKMGYYMDGGTTCLKTDIGGFCIDGRIGSKTLESVYLEYPKDDNSNIVKNQEEIKKQIMDAWKEQTCSGLVNGIEIDSHYKMFTNKCPFKI